MSIYTHDFEEYWKKEEPRMKRQGYFTNLKAIKGCAQKAYEQGRFDEANHTGACIADTVDRERKERLENFDAQN